MEHEFDVIAVFEQFGHASCVIVGLILLTESESCLDLPRWAAGGGDDPFIPLGEHVEVHAPVLVVMLSLAGLGGEVDEVMEPDVIDGDEGEVGVGPSARHVHAAEFTFAGLHVLEQLEFVALKLLDPLPAGVAELLLPLDDFLEFWRV